MGLDFHSDTVRQCHENSKPFYQRHTETTGDFARSKLFQATLPERALAYC